MSKNNAAQQLISVIIPVYNCEQMLVDTLRSVLYQTYDRFEIIIVDDGSDNPVESFLRPLITDDRIHIYRTEHSNANIARNYGIGKSKGDFIAMLDADDSWLENHLSDCLELLLESKADGLFGSLFLRRSLSGSIRDLPVFQARPLKEGESMIDYLLTTGYGAQTSTLFTTAGSMKDILWHPDLIDHQDYDFVVRFSKKYHFSVKHDPTVAYYLSSGRAIHFETCIRFTEENIHDIAPAVYIRYNRLMYQRAMQKAETKQYAAYFLTEVKRYLECCDTRKVVAQPPAYQNLDACLLSGLTLSFCITCLNRLYQIKQTLRQNLDDNETFKDLIEFILVDFGSADGLSEWVGENFKTEIEEGYLNYFYTEELKGWHSSVAKNTAHLLANNQIVVNLDCDNFTGAYGGLFVIDAMIKYGWENAVLHYSGDGSSGRIALSKTNFLKLGGYDESFEPVGYQDMDLCLRAQKMGLHYVNIQDKRYSRALLRAKNTSSKRPWEEMYEHNRQLSMQNIASGKLKVNADKEQIGVVDNLYIY